MRSSRAPSRRCGTPSHGSRRPSATVRGPSAPSPRSNRSSAGSPEQPRGNRRRPTERRRSRNQSRDASAPRDERPGRVILACVRVAVEAVRPGAPGARLFQRPAHLRHVEGVPFRDRHLGSQRHSRVRGPRRRRAPRRPPVAVGRRRRPRLRLLARRPGCEPPPAGREASTRGSRRVAVAAPPFRRAPLRCLSRPATTGSAESVARHDRAPGDEDRVLAQRPGALTGGDLGGGGRDRRGASDATARGAGALGWSSADAGKGPLARARRRPHGAALAHADRLQQAATAQGGVPADLRARHAPEPGGKARSLSLLPRPHLEHQPARRRPATASRSRPPTCAATRAACTSPSRSPTTCKASSPAARTAHDDAWIRISEPRNGSVGLAFPAR